VTERPRIEGAHYRRLAVSRDATTDEIRAAYREAARRHHPDARRARGMTGSDDEMAAINEAWRVLSDPVLRAKYDADLGSGARIDNGTRVGTGNGADPGAHRGANAERVTSEARHNPFARYQDPPRFPWRFIVMLVVVATAVILGVGAFTDPGEPTPIDNVIRVGSCVEIDSVRLEAAEVACTDPHDGLVERLVPFDATCPFDLVGYRDRQGMGTACVRVSSTTLGP
jgi:hypothetical protein